MGHPCENVTRVRGLSLLGKCLIVKCLGISHLTIPNTYIPAIKSGIFNFIWNDKQDKIKRDVMYLDYFQWWFTCSEHRNPF